ncbi:MAG: YitT family protein [Lachnospiraceae bacterium]|nr:YitT family protein [Lachnospiraceae bacterium]MDD7436748.1 YitT family protein [Lachnospiraceae bacterium]MDY3342565.1 YitT family protein [Lachnospiraceae bacterium]
MKENAKRISIDVLVDIIGGILLTIATYSFAVPADFPMTGVSGVALIFYQAFGLPVGALTVILNIPIIICCYKTLGKQFYIKSLRSTLITSAVMDILGPQLPLYQGDLILAAICTGVLLGIGYAIIFMRGSSTGGFDFIMMAIKYYRPHLSLGKIGFALDAMVILIGAVTIGNGMDSVIYGLVLNYLYSTVLDRLISGTSSGKLTLIISAHPREIVDEIDKLVDRGSTLLKAIGGYTGEEKEVVMCASSSKEMYAIRKRVHEIDERAFVIVVESNEVIGEGFRLPDDTNLM